jgi:TonB-dependent SusC/RagA subfamily outer membrane receptor
MKRLILLLLPALFLFNINVKANIPTGGLTDFYKHLTSTIKYPEKARLKDLQGHSIILFTLTDGKLSATNIYAELGSGCDIEVLNQVLAYTNYKSIKNGKYALKTSFKLEGSTSVIENENFKTPEGYTELNVTIVGLAEPKVSYLNPKTDSDQFTKNFQIKWRGSNAPTGTPKIIVDGQEIEYNLANTINPNTIASIEILRDAASVAKYGEIAANGVIIITTKSTTITAPKKEAPVIKKEN